MRVLDQVDRVGPVLGRAPAPQRPRRISSRRALPAAERSSPVGSAVRRTLAISTSRRDGSPAAIMPGNETATQRSLPCGSASAFQHPPGRRWAAARRLGQAGRGARLLGAGHARPHRLPELRLAHRPDRGRGRHRPDRPGHQHPARAGLQPGAAGQGDGQPRPGLRRPPHPRPRGGRAARRLPATGRSFADRGRASAPTWSCCTSRAWRGEPVATAVPGRPGDHQGRIPVLIGGRPGWPRPGARWDAGLTLGGAPPEMAGGAIEEFRRRWAGRQDRAAAGRRPGLLLPRGGAHRRVAPQRASYGFLEDWAEGIAAGAAHPGAVADRRRLRGARRRRALLRPHRGRPGPGRPARRRGGLRDVMKRSIPDRGGRRGGGGPRHRGVDAGRGDRGRPGRAAARHRPPRGRRADAAPVVAQLLPGTGDRPSLVWCLAWPCSPMSATAR